MQHLTAFRLPDGRWQYATTSRRGGGPIGLCVEHEPHQTEIEARECYAAYLRSRLTLDGRSSDWLGCEVCDAPTKSFAEVRGSIRSAALCAEHLTEKIAVEQLGLDQPAGDSWKS